MSRCWVLLAIPLLALPLRALALPVLVSDPIEIPVGVDTEVMLRVEGFSSPERIAAVEVRIPIDVAEYTVVGGVINPELPFFDLLNPAVVFSRFVPQAHYLHLSIAAFNPALELTEPFDFAVVTLRGRTPGAEIALRVGSVIVNGDLRDTLIGGQVIATVAPLETPEPGPFALVALGVGVLLVGRAVRKRRVAVD